MVLFQALRVFIKEELESRLVVSKPEKIITVSNKKSSQSTMANCVLLCDTASLKLLLSNTVECAN